MTHFPKTLNRLMKDRNMGIREAARIAQVSPSTIMSWRAGAAPMNYVAVKRLAEALGTNLAFLLTGENDNQRVETAECPGAAHFAEGDLLFDGYAKITIQKLVPQLPKAEPARSSSRKTNHHEK